MTGSPTHHNATGVDLGKSGIDRLPTVALPVLVDVGTVAASLGVSVRHVRRLVFERRIPFVKMGQFVRFDVGDVTRWIDEQRVVPSDAVGSGPQPESHCGGK